MIVYKSPREIDVMREAGRVARLALDAACAMVRPGVSGSHRLHATLTHQAVQVEGEATFTADGFELGSGLCGCSSAGGLGAVALLALALRRRRRA